MPTKNESAPLSEGNKKGAKPQRGERELEELAERDSRYKKNAFIFLFEALDYTVKQAGKANLSDDKRHVSGPDLLRGISRWGLDQFGPLTQTVLAHWGIHSTRDFGEIVFLLVNAGFMSKTDSDTLEDFVDVYDFAEEFNWKKRKAEFSKPLS